MLNRRACGSLPALEAVLDSVANGSSAMNAESQSFDIVIVGAGPAGLSLAASLTALPLRIAIVERLRGEVLAEPPYDGREIALTRRSLGMMQAIGLLDRIAPQDIAPLRGAKILNGEAPGSLDVHSRDARDLGALVSNHDIRKAAFAAAMANERVTLLAGVGVQAVGSGSGRAWVRLDDGRELTARLVVAADSRFSETRRAMGIPARHNDFGKTMLVCRMQHAVPHGHVAWEWFGHRQTLALLPLNGNCSSIVLTLPHSDIQRVLAMGAAAFDREMETRFHGRLGHMSLASERFAYPLVGVYPGRFIGTRFATVGDASVGMHPVTAHGFNFGLLGQHTLAEGIARAVRLGDDIGSPLMLRRYEFTHRRATLPLYAATNAIVKLYTDDSPPARLARSVLLRIASRFPPVSAGLSRLLSQEPARLPLRRG
jgi:ubiquinone biosynthesis UbiH/UbiF/VisC/COQ6 family hydroxylase